MTDRTKEQLPWLIILAICGVAGYFAVNSKGTRNEQRIQDTVVETHFATRSTNSLVLSNNEYRFVPKTWIATSVQYKGTFIVGDILFVASNRLARAIERNRNACVQNQTFPHLARLLIEQAIEYCSFAPRPLDVADVLAYEEDCVRDILARDGVLLMSHLVTLPPLHQLL